MLIDFHLRGDRMSRKKKIKILVGLLIINLLWLAITVYDLFTYLDMRMHLDIAAGFGLTSVLEIIGLLRIATKEDSE